MKILLQLVALAGLMAFTSGCSTSSPKMESLEGPGCNNPKCQCPKPCQCGSDCQCGMNGNGTKLQKKI